MTDKEITKSIGRPCPNCETTGVFDEEPCIRCNGEGYLEFLYEPERIRALIKQEVEKEREACAQVCGRHPPTNRAAHDSESSLIELTCDFLAAAIRSRGDER